MSLKTNIRFHLLYEIYITHKLTHYTFFFILSPFKTTYNELSEKSIESIE